MAAIKYGRLFAGVLVLVLAASSETAKLSIVRMDSKSFPDIRIHLEVLDGYGNSVRGIRRDEVQVFEDRQAIRDFDFSFIYRNGEWYDIILGIDRSGSMRGKSLETAKAAAETFVNCLSMTDRVALLTYNVKIDFVTDFITDKAEVAAKIRAVETSADTALYDAIAASLAKIRNNTSPRKLMMFFTDGRDTSSKTKLENIREQLEQSRIPCFMVGVGESIDETTLVQISTLPEQGVILNPEDKHIERIYDALTMQMGVHYVLRYRSPVRHTRVQRRVDISYAAPDGKAAAWRYYTIRRPLD